MKFGSQPLIIKRHSESAVYFHIILFSIIRNMKFELSLTVSSYFQPAAMFLKNTCTFFAIHLLLKTFECKFLYKKECKFSLLTPLGPGFFKPFQDRVGGHFCPPAITHDRHMYGGP